MRQQSEAQTGRPAGEDPNFHRYARIYQAFLAAGVPLVALTGGTKKIAHITAPMSRLWDLYQVEAAMDAGLDVGAVTHQSKMRDINPLGFWDLDIDGANHGLDLSPFTFRVRRDGETDRAHYLARTPDPKAKIETSYKGAAHDLCTWNTVMPGSYHKSGTVYELEYMDGGEWIPWDGEPFTLDMLPVVDPEKYRTKEVAEDAEDDEAAVGTSENSVRCSEPRIWVAATGRLITRIKMARKYLCANARPSISGLRGHVALLIVVTNLRLYHRLPMERAINMVKEHFNPRCIDLQGNPCPWTDAEIKHKWDEAGKPGAYPTLGMKDPKAKRRMVAAALETEVAAFLRDFTEQGGSISPRTLLEAFIASRGGEQVKATAFGRAMGKALGLKAKKSNGRWIYPGLHLTGTCLDLTRSAGEGLRAA